MGKYYYIDELHDIIKPDGKIVVKDYADSSPFDKYATVEDAEAILDTTKYIYVPLN